MNTYDHIIKKYCAELLPEIPWQLVKAQVWQESRFDPLAVSSAGAQGLLQLMPITIKELGCRHPFDPEENLYCGIRYLASRYACFREVPSKMERMKFALAAYNGGRAYVNQALALARRSEGLPESYAAWGKLGKPPGDWQLWKYTKMLLQSVECVVQGKRPDYQQMTDYVDKIMYKFEEYI